MKQFNIYRDNVFEVQRYLENEYTKNMKATELEKNRDAQLIIEMRKIINSLTKIPKSQTFLKPYLFKEVMRSIEKIDHLLTESISLFPDLYVWMFCGNKQVGVCTIKSHDIIWSPKDSKRGLICNKFVYTDIKVTFKKYENQLHVYFYWNF